MLGKSMTLYYLYLETELTRMYNGQYTTGVTLARLQPPIIQKLIYVLL